MQCLNMCLFQAERMQMLHQVFLSLLVYLLLLAMGWFCQWYQFHHSSFHAKVARRALLPRCLKPRSPLDCPACCDAETPVSGATVARGQKSAGSTQTGQDRGLCLPEPSLWILRDQGCGCPCAFSAMVCMDVLSRSRPFAVRRVRRPSALAAIPPCIG
jgi:hypothetical protein